jgi:hypothetical protein
MNDSEIRRDKITPAWIEAYRRFREYVDQKLDKLGEEEKSLFNFCLFNMTPKRYPENYGKRFEKELSEFKAGFPGCDVNDDDFWFALVHHPLGWDIIYEKFHKGCVDMERLFNKISSYSNK